ncbi:hypothetical protein HK096_009350 [Nowakowskiella sp. JEL0078]|nr:hypothetical protein HK096_009350 [Nowakowskiella sp. JEL0078]
MTPKNCFDLFPEDILIEIVKLIDIRSYTSFALISRNCAHIIKSPSSIWRRNLLALDPFRVLIQVNPATGYKHIDHLKECTKGDWRTIVRILRDYSCQNPQCSRDGSFQLLVGPDSSGRFCSNCMSKFIALSETTTFENNSDLDFVTTNIFVPGFWRSQSNLTFTELCNFKDSDDSEDRSCNDMMCVVHDKGHQSICETTKIYKGNNASFEPYVIFVPNEYLFPEFPTCIVDPTRIKLRSIVLKSLQHLHLNSRAPIRVSSIAEALALERQGEHILIHRGIHQYGPRLDEVHMMDHPYSWVQEHHTQVSQFDERENRPYLANLVPTKIVGESVAQYLSRTSTQLTPSTFDLIPPRPLISNSVQSPFVCYAPCILDNIDIRTGVSHIFRPNSNNNFPTIEICRHTILRCCRIESASLCAISAYLLQGKNVAIVLEECTIVSTVKSPAIMYESVEFVKESCRRNIVSAVGVDPIWHFDQYTENDAQGKDLLIQDVKILTERLKLDGNLIIRI